MFNKNIFKIEYGIAGLIISFLIYLLATLGAFSPIIDSLRTVTNGLQVSLYQWGQDINEGLLALNNVNTLSEKSDNLQLENILLQSQIADLNKQIDQLEKQLAQQFKMPNKTFVQGEIRYMSEKMSEIILNIGSYSGVVVGDIVVIGNVPIGEVTEVGSSYSRVKGIFSEDIKIPIKFSNSNIVGFLSYEYSKGFLVKNLPSEFEFENNEQVITTGVNSPYFYGLLIGGASELIGSPTDPSKTVSIHYPIDLLKTQTVFVILNSHFEVTPTQEQ